MEEVSGPIIAIALVLCAVFVPVAFISGLTGQFYRQFALTIAFSTVISAFNSLTLSPALAAVLLRAARRAAGSARRACIESALGWLFRPFNRVVRTRVGSVTAQRARVHRRASGYRARGVRRAGRARRPRLLAGAARVSCRRRTSSTSWRSRSCPTPRRSTAPRAVVRKMAEIALTTARRRQRGAVPRASRSTASPTSRTPPSCSSRSSRSRSARARS